jgi:hypothetical protein
MNDQIQTEKPANPFLPIALVAISIICFLGPTAWDASRIKTDLTAARDQQAAGLAQSQPSMARFQKVMMDLLQLAQTDADAKQIIAKYGIAVQQPPQAQPPR